MKLAQTSTRLGIFLLSLLLVSSFFNSPRSLAADSTTSSKSTNITSQNQVAIDLPDIFSGIQQIQQTLGDLISSLNPINIGSYLFGSAFDVVTGGISRFAQWIIKEGMLAVLKGFINATDIVFLNGQGVFDQSGNVNAENRHNGIWSFNLVKGFYENQPKGNTLNTLAFIAGGTLPFSNKATAQSPATGPWTRTGLASREVTGIANELWQVLRNVAYLLIAVILVIFGFAVMFRHKTDPRTIVTVEQAIPALALGLVAITFSSLVPALALDFSKIIQATTYNLFKPLNRVVPGVDCIKNIVPGTVGPVIGNRCEPIPVRSPLDLTFNGPLDDITGGMVNLLGVPSGMDGVVAWAMNFGMLITYITIFALVMLRYASLIIRTVLGPLVIALGIIPGQGGGIANWLKGCFADGLSIAGIYFMVNLAVYLWDLGTIINPAPVVLKPVDLVAGGSTGNMVWVLGIAVSILATKVPAYVDEALGTSPTAASRSGVDFRQSMRATPLVGQFF